MKQRDPTSDLLRAVAILMVTFFHAWRKTGRMELFVAGEHLNLYKPLSHGPIGVAVFVFLSGYVLTAYFKPVSYGKFLFRRWQRISVPYYAAIAFWLVANLWVNSLQPQPSSRDVLYHLLFVHTFDPNTFITINSVLWYLGLLFQLYLVFPLLHRLLLSKVGPVVVMAGSVLLCVFGDQLLTRGVVTGKSRMLVESGLLTYLFPFCAGMTLARYPKFRMTMEKKWIGVFAIFSLLTAYALFKQTALIPSHELDLRIRAILLSVWFIMLAPLWIASEKWLKPLTLLGQISFSVYLYNYVMYMIPLRTGGIEGILSWSFLTIAFSLGMYVMVEKPWGDWLAARRKKTNVAC